MLLFFYMRWRRFLESRSGWKRVLQRFRYITINASSRAVTSRQYMTLLIRLSLRQLAAASTEPLSSLGTREPVNVVACIYDKLLSPGLLFVFFGTLRRPVFRLKIYTARR